MLDVDTTVATHGWIQETAHTPDIRLRSHRITLTYNKLGQLWDEVNFFDFATWGTHTVGKVIRGDLAEYVMSWLGPVQHKVAHHLSMAQLSMFENVAHEGIDRFRYARGPIDMMKTATEEQQRVTKGITDACDTIADHWNLDRALVAGFFTQTMGAELPNETLLPSVRIAGTSGEVGAPVEDYRSLRQRLMWIRGILETHMEDRSLKSMVYTPEQEEQILKGTLVDALVQR